MMVAFRWKPKAGLTRPLAERGHSASKCQNQIQGGSKVDLGVTDKVRPLIAAVRAMVRDEIMPLEEAYEAEVGREGDRFKPTKRMIEIRESLKAKARAKSLWNFWLTGSDKGYGLSTVEYAYLAEEMGWSPLASEIFNCSAPDTGNMEVIERYGTGEQKARWLPDLLEGRARSAYLMTEPGVASSDATNIAMDARLDGDEWVLNGEKWWSSGAGDPRCSLYITMTLTDPDAAPHARHSMLLVPAATQGIEILRAMKVYGDDDAPHGHMHIRFRDVRVPKDAIVLGRGRGFEIAQGRLGPGRIHHCMRCIGVAERALETMCKRVLSRVAFGKLLAEQGTIRADIARSRMEIEQARLLTLKAAHMMDTAGNKKARAEIAMIKVVAPNVALRVLDRAIQAHGGAGVSQDTFLAAAWANVRTLRIADGPDEVHTESIAKFELRKWAAPQPRPATH
jgi:acyl-CoA dehydrogenase